jgi:hypothetical protein
MNIQMNEFHGIDIRDKREHKYYTKIIKSLMLHLQTITMTLILNNKAESS